MSSILFSFGIFSLLLTNQRKELRGPEIEKEGEGETMSD